MTEFLTGFPDKVDQFVISLLRLVSTLTDVSSKVDQFLIRFLTKAPRFTWSLSSELYKSGLLPKALPSIDKFLRRSNGRLVQFLNKSHGAPVRFLI